MKVITISLNSDQWLDPSTVKLFLTVTNTTTNVNIASSTPVNLNTDLIPLTPGSWGFFRRMRIICGGQIVEDIDYYNRVHEMFHERKPAEKKGLMTLSKALVFMKHNFIDLTKQRLITRVI